MAVLFCLQVAPHDVDAGIELARLICDVAQAPKLDYEWLISYRRDTPVTRIAAIQAFLSKRFAKVSVHRAQLHGDGWPAGANALWSSTMLHAGRLKTTCQGILTFEADCVPARLDWMEVITEAYRRRKRPVVGNLHRCETIEDHINGNAIWPLDLLTRYPQLGETPPIHAWDYFHRELILSLAEDTPAIMQLYARRNLSEAEWLGLNKFGQRPALLHGIKDGTARELARRSLVIKKGLAPSVERVLIPGHSPWSQPRLGKVEIVLPSVAGTLKFTGGTQYHDPTGSAVRHAV